jgi:hypothetical protein
VLYEFVGSCLPFARTRADRAETGDGRPSIEERYASRDEYVQRAIAAAGDLVARGFLLPGDRDAAVRRAIAAYDAVTAR